MLQCWIQVESLNQDLYMETIIGWGFKVSVLIPQTFHLWFSTRKLNLTIPSLEMSKRNFHLLMLIILLHTLDTIVLSSITLDYLMRQVFIITNGIIFLKSKFKKISFSIDLNRDAAGLGGGGNLPEPRVDPLERGGKQVKKEKKAHVGLSLRRKGPGTQNV